MYERLSQASDSIANDDSTQTTSLLERPKDLITNKFSNKREIVLNLLLDSCMRLGQVERAVEYVD